MAWSASVGSPMLVDWQIIYLDSCFTDISYFVMTAPTAEDRRAHEMDILDNYLAWLHDFGGPHLSRDDPEVMDEYASRSWPDTPLEDHDPVTLL
ncbi:aminoglycoside phosphotransferase [Ophiostoma piceae UAMH 11346]|uniref:Aminoglycoside phosphotransferase n=1 Tax=Ophiostoma piceae (strain UAMH 11346) TaxID=1262450 RepID=S3C447_OPHP1|nr:aminoglycoside phosphotransferase [Ophiostoma piceae UAMH 11346]